MKDSLYIAIDLGAGSGRVFLAGAGSGELLLEEIRRFQYPPQRSGGHLRWDFGRIFDELKSGLRAAALRAVELGRPIQSIGVDSWGVDYGLIDAGGALIEDPVCYRDERTQGMIERVCSIIPRTEVFARTGIQFLEFNTVFQLYAHAREGISPAASKLLLIPDLINFKLTGRALTEFTNATTTQLVNAATGGWDWEMIEKLGLPAHLMAEIVPVGSDLGPLRDELASWAGMEGTRVIAPATHDTGSAVAGTSLEEGWAYISSGTWSLVGIELDRPLINDLVSRHNFTNEGGAFGAVRFLKNVMGLWIFESCRREWKESGDDIDYDHILDQVMKFDKFTGLIYPDDPRFLNPSSMSAALADQMSGTGQTFPAGAPALTKAIMDSLAFRYASVLSRIEKLTGRKIEGVHIVGGGSRNDYLNQATANAARKPVLAGPIEATVIGNVLVQAVAAGRFTSLEEARRHAAANIKPRLFEPQTSRAWEEAAKRYAAIEEKMETRKTPKM